MNNIESNETPTKLGLIKIVIVIVIAASFIFWRKNYAPTRAEEVLRTAKPLTFHGRIDSIYRDRSNHDEMYAILSDGNTYGIYRPWESIVKIGDSLYKSAGDLKVVILKQNGQKAVLDYEELVKGFNKVWWEREREVLGG